ncbi:hypothetical protein GE061_001290 [Apolygus lucorum]|uniref:Farnesoic acid O-methyl transferase domain-containing protein n=1 Tax=Apolygus lucorum TaxID=248454 RepID=A0A8S9Y8E1_APOLU|nr:hypothetical protein GE061_001290 [Apolygus lucorum]
MKEVFSQSYGASERPPFKMPIEIPTEDKLEYKFFPNYSQALKFKVKAPNDAHVAITEGPVEANPMYEIFFGGWGNSKIAIRKNREKPEVIEQPYPNTLSAGEFKDFWITWYDGALNIGLDDNPTPFLSWSDPAMLNGQFFGIRTAWGATGSWIIEDNWSGWRAPASTPWQEIHDSPGWNIGPPEPMGTAQPTWVPTSGSNIPPDAVPGGFDNEQLYIGRASHAGALTPGKVVPSHGVCYVAWGGAEHGIRDYEVLTGCNPSWIPVLGDQVPEHAFPAGNSETGEPLFIGRAQHGDTVTVGKVQKTHKVCYIPYGGQEIAKENFEVMVL